MPTSADAHGLQLWVNLAAKDKMVDPAYQELKKEDIATASGDGVSVSIIAGKAFGVESKVYTRTPAYYMDFTLDPGATLSQEIPSGWTAFSYTLTGTSVFGDASAAKAVEAHHTVVFSSKSNETHVVASNPSQDTSSRFVLIAGAPLGEPVAQHGPFVMNNREQLHQAMSDYQMGRNGFERAPSWSSGN
jgi:redox-sensitive bicupin YhaK (pirin superfamily)